MDKKQNITESYSRLWTIAWLIFLTRNGKNATGHLRAEPMYDKSIKLTKVFYFVTTLFMFPWQLLNFSIFAMCIRLHCFILDLYLILITPSGFSWLTKNAYFKIILKIEFVVKIYLIPNQKQPICQKQFIHQWFKPLSGKCLFVMSIEN